MSKLKQVKVNFSLEDYEHIKQNAMNKNITIAEFIRQKFDFSIETPPVNRSISNFQKVDPCLLFELNEISISLNKIAETMVSDIEINTFILMNIYQHVMRLKC